MYCGINKSEMEYLLDKTSYINTWHNKLKNDLGRSILHISAYYGHYDILMKLLDRNHTTIIQQDKDGRNPLHLAAGRGCSNCVRSLLQYYDDMVDQKDYFGKTPIEYANNLNKEALDHLTRYSSEKNNVGKHIIYLKI
ncbi:MAG: hypothetical protein CMF41_04090 [Legionellales bacterium]|nr:hypothetical protein [Legionellales bacterium]|tara:strand:- start:5872 stop:6285 length:414 start_codon:yes stop_codon:yes gene_type:complete